MIRAGRVSLRLSAEELNLKALFKKHTERAFRGMKECILEDWMQNRSVFPSILDHYCLKLKTSIMFWVRKILLKYLGRD